ncbi:MAG: universal stress protein [Syntrophobacterales bacterium]|nr:universal stress protein [Syntrophobacterales bacterium]
MIQFSKILIPVDFSENSQKAVNYGLSLARTYDAKVYMMHVISQRIVDAIHELSIKGYKGDFVEIMKDVRQDREREMRTLVTSSTTSEDLSIEFILKEGKPGSEIVEAAKELQVDLIVIGHQGRSALGSLLLGSVAQYVVNHTPCPILVVPSIQE